MAIPLTTIVLCGSIGLFLLLGQVFLWGGMFIGIAGALLVLCLRNIPATPPHVGLVKIWGERKPKIKREGWRIFAPFFPLMYDNVLVNVEKKNPDFSFEDIRARSKDSTEADPRSGGEIAISIGLTYTPDYKSDDAGERLIQYINSGGEKGVNDIIEDLIEEYLRELTPVYTWEQFTFSRGEIRAGVMEKLTGKEGETTTKELAVNGRPDVAGLGIRIWRLAVGKTKEQGELAKAAEAFATEEQQRLGETVELRHVKDRAKELQTELKLSGKDAVEVVQTERRKVEKKIQEYKGLEGLGEGIGKGIGKGLGAFRKK